MNSIEKKIQKENSENIKAYIMQNWCEKNFHVNLWWKRCFHESLYESILITF